jgi:hypothetical protein
MCLAYQVHYHLNQCIKNTGKCRWIDTATIHLHATFEVGQQLNNGVKKSFRIPFLFSFFDFHSTYKFPVASIKLQVSSRAHCIPGDLHRNLRETEKFHHFTHRSMITSIESALPLLKRLALQNAVTY